MADLPERLRSGCVGYPDALVKWPHRLLHEAADEIERLRFESAACLGEMRAAQRKLVEFKQSSDSAQPSKEPK